MFDALAALIAGQNSSASSSSSADDEKSSRKRRGHSSDTTSSSTASSSSSAASDDESSTELRARPTAIAARRQITRALKHDTYFTGMTDGVLRAETASMTHYLEQFRQHLPRGATRPLVCTSMRIDVNRLAQPVTEVPGTFLVKKTLDYIYAYLIDVALSGPVEDDDDVQRQRQRQDYQRTKRDRTRFCTARHPPSTTTTTTTAEKLCPAEYVLYTRGDSEFYQFCDRLLAGNKYVNYALNTKVVTVEKLSPHLVQFLCGNLVEEQGLDVVHTTVPDDHLLWLSVPLFFLDLWNARHGV